jgi:multidrug efflux pump subunit AcrA (membrane-fusion protein)
VGLAGLVGISMIPFPFYIQAPAYLEPIQQRFIHASADSFIEELLVHEGETVNADQPLVQLRSPALELQSQEALGQASALEEKRNGLRIAVNQLSSTPSDPSNQTRLSADLKLVEIQEKQAKEKVAFLKIQQGELLLKSPIQGVVIGGDLRRELNDRPLQRGDVLFRIAEIHGPWRLRLLVADRDGAYIQKALEQGPIPIDWGLENSTGKGLRATLNAIAKEVDQQPTLGPCRIAMADVDVQQIDQPVIGAVAYTRIACGRQPLWFIWSRPMVEFLQKRFWLVSPPSPIPLTET